MSKNTQNESNKKSILKTASEQFVNFVSIF